MNFTDTEGKAGLYVRADEEGGREVPGSSEVASASDFRRPPLEVIRNRDYEFRGGPTLVYQAHLHVCGNREVQELYQPLDLDRETRIFLDAYCQGDESIFRDLAARFLKLFWSVTDTNAFLGRGQMFVFSTNQVGQLLRASGLDLDSAWSRAWLLDVGAGDGNVTARLAPFVSHVVATEVSHPMLTRLSKRGYTSVFATNLDEAPLPRQQYEIVSCLNVLDRASHPITLLGSLKARVTPETGRILLAVVLPFCPFVESGTKQLEPSEIIPIDGGRCSDGATFEVAVSCMVKSVLQPMGFRVHSWTMLPYICSGDRTTPYYVLHDAVFVLSCPAGP